MSNNQYEILAPAGNMDALVCAVNNGANAVYLGLEEFNARMNANNFTRDNFAYAVGYCHLFGVKVYVTVNTSIKNDEYKYAKDLICFVYDNYADGVIVTDLSLLKFASNLVGNFEVVASTQLNCHDYSGAMFLKQLGATTIVASRECTYENIKDIARAGVKVECFIQGALCVCQSGQCLFSSIVGGNSGNRGLCAQPCRKFYSCDESGKSGYLLSAKDLCAVNHLNKLHDAGASVFKIEGRNRRAEYSGLASRIYKNVATGNVCGNEEYLLKEMFNRGNYTHEEYLSGSNAEIIYPSVQNHIGVNVGKIVKGKFVANKTLSKGDGLKVFNIDGTEYCGGVVVSNGENIYVKFSDKVSDGMTVSRTTSVELCNNVVSAERKVDVSAKVVAKANEPIKLAIICNYISVDVIGELCQTALNKPTTKEEIIAQLQKTGNSCFTISDIVVDCDDIFIAKSQINALRREGLDKLSQAIIDKYNGNLSRAETAIEKDVANVVNNNGANRLFVICYNAEQVDYCLSQKLDIIYKPENINFEVLKPFSGKGIYVDVPSFCDDNYLANLLLNIDIGIVAHNIGTVEVCRNLHKKYIAGTGLNIYNDFIAGEFSDADFFFYSEELTLSEISTFKNKTGITFVDGNLVLMKTVHCPFKVNGLNCSNCHKLDCLTYKDELGNQFVFKRRKVNVCTFELSNGKKLSVVNKLKCPGNYVVDYDINVIEHYKNLNNGVVDSYEEKQQYTKGRLYSKVN